jgi:hypothetical protein
VFSANGPTYYSAVALYYSFYPLADRLLWGKKQQIEKLRKLTSIHTGIGHVAGLFHSHVDWAVLGTRALREPIPAFVPLKQTIHRRSALAGRPFVSESGIA